MKTAELPSAQDQSVTKGSANRLKSVCERCRPFAFATLPLTVLLASAVSGAAQAPNHPFVSLLSGATTGAATGHLLPSSIEQEKQLVDVSIPNEDLITENRADRPDADGGSSSLSTTRSYDGLVTQAPIPEPRQPDITANPGRPAMATSALLTPIGYAQFETGFLYANSSAGFSNRGAEEETMRITVAPRAQLIFAGEPIADSQVGQQQSLKTGDTTAGMQVVLMPGHAVKPTISASYLRLLRLGTATSLDIGGYVNSALLMESADLGHFHIDSNEFLDETEGPIRRMQFGQAVAVTHPVTAKLSATAELRHFTEPLNGGDGLSALWAAGYAVRPNLVIDTGLVHGFTANSTQWQVASGVTYVLPRRIWGFSRTPDQH